MLTRLLATVAWAALCASAAAAGSYVEIPGGRFESVLPQGASPTASTPVDVRGFAMRVTPVTVGEYLEFLRTHPQWQRQRVARLFAEQRYLIDWAAPLD